MSLKPLELVRAASFVVMAGVWLFVLGKSDPLIAAAVGVLIVGGAGLLWKLPSIRTLSKAQKLGLHGTFWFSLIALPVAYFLSKFIGPLGPVALMIGIGVAGFAWWKLNVADQRRCQQLRDKAHALVKAGDYGEAETVLKKVLNLAMQLKANRVDTLSRAFQDLTTLYCQMARWPEAEEYCLRAISAMEEPGTAAQRLLPATLEQLASIYANQRNFNSFDLALEKSAELYAEQLGENSPEAAAKYLQFAKRAEDENRFKAASKFYRASLAKVEDALGHHAEPVAQIHLLLGNYSERTDRLDEALQSYRVAVQVNEKVFGPEDPKIVPALEATAHALIKQGAPARATEALERAVRITQEELGPHHTEVGRLLIPLAECALATGDLAVAEEHAVNAVRILEGDQDPALHQALAVAARAKVAAGEAKAADSLFSNAISLLQQAVGTTHPELARYLDGRAEAADLLGKPDDAERWRSRAIEIRQACTA